MGVVAGSAKRAGRPSVLFGPVLPVSLNLVSSQLQGCPQGSFRDFFRPSFVVSFRLGLVVRSVKREGSSLFFFGALLAGSQAECRRDFREAQGTEEPDRRNLSCSHVRQDKGVGPGVGVSTLIHYAISRAVDDRRGPATELTPRRDERNTRATSAGVFLVSVGDGQNRRDRRFSFQK